MVSVAPITITETTIDPAIDSLITEVRKRVCSDEEYTKEESFERRSQLQIEYEAHLRDWLAKVFHLIPQALWPYITHSPGCSLKPGTTSRESLTIHAPNLCPLDLRFTYREANGWELDPMIDVSVPGQPLRAVKGLDRAIVFATENYKLPAPSTNIRSVPR